MNKRLLTTVIFILFIGIMSAFAKEIRTVVFQVNQMECENCERKVRSNIKFEKGLKSVTTDLETKTVTITYDADKTSIENIQEGFKKFNYEATVVKDYKKESKKK